MRKFKMQVEDEETKNTVSSGLCQFKKEVPELPKNIIPQAKLTLDHKDIMNFTVDYTPEKESFWYPGVYTFSFSVPDNYSINPPKVLCKT